MDLFTGGKVGEMFASLAFSSAFVATVSFYFADRNAAERSTWERLGKAGFYLHALGIFGLIGTLFMLIYFQQYQYHYVWSHASNELPIYYIIACFWEGQEGSFLLWSFWHSILGLVILRRGGEWRNIILAVLSSIELIVSSMVLGIYVGEAFVGVLYAILLLLTGGYLLYVYFQSVERPDRGKLPLDGSFHLGGGILATLGLVLLLRGQTGFWEVWTFGGFFQNIDSVFFGLFVLGLLGYVGLMIGFTVVGARDGWKYFPSMVAGLGAVGMAYVAAAYDPSVWKIGSTPFILLKDAMPDAPIYAQNPDFIPTNGNGLNPLLQNYWMVIHPPTIFLGFAASAIPFSYVVGGLIRGQYTEWIRPSLPWTLMTAMILGIGLIMGGYWAYETLNFGGYWNWDPVENSSLVPWLCGVAALHSMLVYQKARTYLKTTMVLVMSTFLLVLYSTFLTRSGILGETSVHTFTDLGLSGQLLVLVLVYLMMIVLLMAANWKSIPTKADDAKVWSAEFFLFLAVLVLLFSSFVIIFTTSLPVINKILGTHFAPPPKIQLFYYQWTVWFAVLFGVLSGIGQFLWWRKAKQANLSDALFRPFLAAVVSGGIIVVALLFYQKAFVFDSTFEEWISAERLSFANTIQKGILFVQYGVLTIADELLLFASLFAVFANTDILISLLRKNRKGLKVMGGTVVHIGFALMLIGMLFSSGYDEVISKNMTPEDLAAFPEQEKADNVLLVKNRARPILGYNVQYLGKKEAVAPIHELTVIEESGNAFKVSFRDSTKDKFSMVLPRDVFLKKAKEHKEEHEHHDHTGEIPVHPTSDKTEKEEKEGALDLQYVEDFLNKNLEFLKPPHINNRQLFGLAFQSVKDPSDHFVMYPEAEMNETMQSIIAHPSRKIYLTEDIYVHVSSTPSEEQEDPKYRYHQHMVGLQDTFRVGSHVVKLKGVENLTGSPELKGFSVAVAENLEIYTSRMDTFTARPIYFVGEDDMPRMIESVVDGLGLSFTFGSIKPKDPKPIMILVQEQTNFEPDWIVFKAIRKPFINVLWLGTFILVIGFIVSIYRRAAENRRKRT